MNKVTSFIYERFFEPEVKEQLSELEDQNDFLKESMTRLELEMENEGWLRLNQSMDASMDQMRLKEIMRVAVQMAIRNPITCRSVSVQADYVFGQGLRYVAKNPQVQAVIDEFADNYHNRRALTSHSSLLRAEKQNQVTGNLFFALFTNTDTGRVSIRCIDVQEVSEILRDPNDPSRELWIRRSYQRKKGGGEEEVVIYNPAFGHHVEEGKSGITPKELDPDWKDGSTIQWTVPIYHVAFNRWCNDKFAVPEVTPQIPYAIAYKKYIEDWCSIMATYARLAFKMTGLGSGKQMAAVRSKLQTSTTLSDRRESNPSPAAGSFALLKQGMNAEPIKTAGSTTSAAEGQPVLNMAAAAHGLPNSFYGDVSKGNHATATTLDRPTELKMVSRQKLWSEILHDIIEYVILQSAKATEGLLNKDVTVEMVKDLFLGEPVWVIKPNPDFDVSFEVVFPEILERNVTDRVRALVNALTLFGKPLTDIVPDKKLACRWLLEALKVPNVEKLLPEFMAMWEKNMKAKPDGKPVEAGIIPPTLQPPKMGAAGGAVDPSQGGAVGSNG